MLGNFACFFGRLCVFCFCFFFFFILFIYLFFVCLFFFILKGIPSECQTVWIQIRSDVLSGLIWIQTVCKGYQQTIRVVTSGERVNILSSICFIFLFCFFLALCGPRQTRKKAFEHAQNAQIQNSKVLPSICSPFIYSVVSNDCVRRHGWPNSDCRCAGWSGPSLPAYARRNVIAWRGQYLMTDIPNHILVILILIEIRDTDFWIGFTAYQLKCLISSLL